MALAGRLRVEDGQTAAIAVRPAARWARTTLRVSLAVMRPLVAVGDMATLLVATVVIGGAGSAGFVYTAAALATLALAGDYRFRITPRFGRAAWWLAAYLTLPLALLTPFLGNEAAVDLLRALPYAAGLVIAGRLVTHAVQRSARRRGLVVEPTLIVGAGEMAVTIAHTLYRHPEYGLRPVGIVDDVDEQMMPAVLGHTNSLEQILAEYEVRRVIVAFGTSRENQLVPVLRACTRRHAEVYITPRFFELGVTQVGPESEEVWGIPLVRLKRSAFRPTARVAKRVFDLVVASTALVLVSPILAVAAVAVRLGVGKPILFRQKRVGQDGRPIEVLKFRTMPPNGDSDTTWSVRDDHRVGHVGRLLRRTSIDELPQLFNVVRGDMSIVGPRPERPHFFDQFSEEIPGYEDRQRVPVGITGWAQVHGLRGDTSIEERARFDNHYIEHWSPWFDVVICARTISTMFRDHD